MLCFGLELIYQIRFFLWFTIDAAKILYTGEGCTFGSGWTYQCHREGEPLCDMSTGDCPNGCYDGSLAWYVKLWAAHAPWMPGTFFPPPRVSNPDMHHGACVTHVPGIPGAIHNFTYLIRGPWSNIARSLMFPRSLEQLWMRDRWLLTLRAWKQRMWGNSSSQVKALNSFLMLMGGKAIFSGSDSGPSQVGDMDPWPDTWPNLSDLIGWGQQISSTSW